MGENLAVDRGPGAEVFNNYLETFITHLHVTAPIVQCAMDTIIRQLRPYPPTVTIQ